MTTHNDNESNQLTFPLQINDAHVDTMTHDEIATDLRLRIAMSLNKVSAGEDVMDEKLIAWINRVNALLVRGNYDPVPVDFAKFGVHQNSNLCLVSSTNT